MTPQSNRPESSFTIRDGEPSDLDVIVDYNLRLAEETEDKRLDRVILRNGVARALADPERLRYWVAVSRDDGRVVGQTAITREWSDWRAGWLWWLQSVYVEAESRGQGVFKALYGRIRDEALATDDVLGIRLYVEHENHRARDAYKALGMDEAGYSVLEELWLGRSRAKAE
ncbi:GNAT family N-acetyltransferase [Planctomyces sp. SH-PL62]|uniref:GNAT family N-acetyltransferase n=1 Tax=Planctomyces sp. SH-PL62 TaxID=1636152 RepID=UPI00078E5EC2|nr:GNAT family N-acetyltransferase [Planctomyces sp. SH-PL62]AMV39500.1 Acetyltransferase (GNAT) family protein [Planctomyces sp. SH-PL62]